MEAVYVIFRNYLNIVSTNAVADDTDITTIRR